MSASKEQIIAFLEREFSHSGSFITIESVGDRASRIRRSPAKEDLRPGNTVSGPFMMALVDTALYVTILGELGLVALAVTTNLNINFLHRPQANVDVIAECRLIKVGKKLIVGEVSLYSDGFDQPIAHATGTYALPPSALPPS